MKDRIKAIRKEQGLTQQQLADLFGVKRNTVAQWETGANALTNQTIEQYVKAFNINREWLESGIGEMHRQQDDIAIIADTASYVMDLDPKSDTFDLIQKAKELERTNPELLHKIIQIIEILAK